MVTFAATVFLDVLYGLIIGVAFSALVVFVRSQFSKAFAIGRFDSTEFFKPSALYASVSSFSCATLYDLLCTLTQYFCLNSVLKIRR